MYILLIKTLC